MTREDWLRREDRKRYTLSALASFLLLGLVSVAGIPLSGRPGALTVPRVDEFAVSLEVRAGQSEPAGRTTAPDADQAALGHHGPGTEPPRPSPAPQPAREDAAAPVASVTAAPKPAQPRPSDDAQAASGAADAAENDSGTEGSPPPAQETMQGSRWLEGAPPASGAGEGSPGSRNEGASAGREGMDGSPGPAADSAASTGATTDPTAALSAQLGAFIEVNKVYPEAARRRGTKGIVYLALSVGPDGDLESIRTARSSGSKLLDEAALKLLRSAFPLKKGPGRRLDLALAIRYDLRY